MRRVMMVLCCLILVGCSNQKDNEQVALYNRLIKETENKQVENPQTLPFDIEVYCEQLIDDEVTYRVIIDNPKEEIYDIKAIAVHNRKTDNIYPTSGIFEAPLNLIPNKVDLKNNNAKGIILVGYIDYNGKMDDFTINIKTLIEYQNKEGKKKQIIYSYHK